MCLLYDYFHTHGNGSLKWVPILCIFVVAGVKCYKLDIKSSTALPCILLVCCTVIRGISSKFMCMIYTYNCLFIMYFHQQMYYLISRYTTLISRYTLVSRCYSIKCEALQVKLQNIPDKLKCMLR